MKYINLKKYKGNSNKPIIISVVILTIISSLIILCCCSLGNNKVLIIRNNTSGSTTKFYLSDNSFSLGYMHSVMKTPAEEFFHINDKNEIVLDRTIYESFGVGLPFLADKNEFEIKNGKFILYTKETLPKINMTISPIPKHWLRIGDIKYEFMDILESPNCSITIYAENRSKIKDVLKFIDISKK